MVQTLKNHAARISDRMLARVAPKMVADAACGAWVFCCGYDSAGRYVLGEWRRDVEHSAICTPCYSLGVFC